ncbi:hypothetical protein L596_014285 [Steinernema carpocapsae]|uniref:Uncharacterized protein n=1 Tax=Steinernema carpocapsae TaxID=34508 RepID=A0A4V6XW72_STECR|nr:hypothetical protein L596_014285 [Steinernema carpocapsae]
MRDPNCIARFGRVYICSSTPSSFSISRMKIFSPKPRGFVKSIFISMGNAVAQFTNSSSRKGIPKRLSLPAFSPIVASYAVIPAQVSVADVHQLRIQLGDQRRAASVLELSPVARIAAEELIGAASHKENAAVGVVRLLGPMQATPTARCEPQDTSDGIVEHSEGRADDVSDASLPLHH